jgi:hypothetical protein
LEAGRSRRHDRQMPRAALHGAIVFALAQIACNDPSADAPESRHSKNLETPVSTTPSTRGGEGKAGMRGGAASPEEAFAELKRSANEGDYRSFFLVLHPDARYLLLGGLFLGAGFSVLDGAGYPDASRDEQLKAILNKHGLEERAIRVEPRLPARMAAEAEELLRTVKDPPDLFHDLAAHMRQTNSNKQPTFDSLEDLAMEGDDRATATMVVKDARGDMSRDPIEFRRIGRRWYVVFLTP